MAQVNSCLKRIFTIFNILFAITGGLIILFGLVSHFYSSINGGENLAERTYALVFIYIVGAITMVVAILGAHGAHKESRGCMIAFLVCMVVGTLLMLRAGLFVSINGPEAEGSLKDLYDKFVPLDNASDEVKEMTNNFQTKWQCCGYFSYKDWRDSIPDSCVCSPVEVEEGMCQTLYSRDLFLMSKAIYSKPCFPILFHYFVLAIDVMMGIMFTLAGLALLGTILSSIIIHQMRYSTTSTVVLKVPAVFTTSPPKYEELQNVPPPYC
ncbi:Tetraspanin-8 [Channa argus]|uniref:Tetraspanin n=1 Tax=Channa argus TaxID=215402 RepID=A0A6G1QRR8_CHAAH|nr:Tetraspanin-8 [Channa argus]